MILQIIPHRLIRNLALYTRCSQHLWIANTRQLQDLWRLNSTARHNDFALHTNGLSVTLVGEVDADSLFLLELDRCDRRLTQDVQIRSLCIRGEIATCCVASLPLVWAGTQDSAERVEEANVIARPSKPTLIDIPSFRRSRSNLRIDGLLRNPGNLIESLLKIILNRQKRVVE